MFVPPHPGMSVVRNAELVSRWLHLPLPSAMEVTNMSWASVVSAQHKTQVARSERRILRPLYCVWNKYINEWKVRGWEKRGRLFKSQAHPCRIHSFVGIWKKSWKKSAPTLINIQWWARSEEEQQPQRKIRQLYWLVLGSVRQFITSIHSHIPKSGSDEEGNDLLDKEKQTHHHSHSSKDWHVMCQHVVSHYQHPCVTIRSAHTCRFSLARFAQSG